MWSGSELLLLIFIPNSACCLNRDLTISKWRLGIRSKLEITVKRSLYSDSSIDVYSSLLLKRQASILAIYCSTSFAFCCVGLGSTSPQSCRLYGVTARSADRALTRTKTHTQKTTITAPMILLFVVAVARCCWRPSFATKKRAKWRTTSTHTHTH